MVLRALIPGLVVLSLFAGCTSSPPLVSRCRMPWHEGHRNASPALVGLEYGERATPIPLNSVQFSSDQAVRSLSIQRLAAARTATNTVEVSARFISCEDAPFAVRVRTSFLDGQQVPTEPASAWQTVYLQPHLIANYSERSLSAQASQYLIEIMPQ